MSIDPNAAPESGAQLHTVSVRLTQEEVDGCLSRLMGFTRPPDECLPLIVALGTVKYSSRRPVTTSFDSAAIAEAVGRIGRLVSAVGKTAAKGLAEMEENGDGCLHLYTPEEDRRPLEPAPVSAPDCEVSIPVSDEEDEELEEWLTRVPGACDSQTPEVSGEDPDSCAPEPAITSELGANRIQASASLRWKVCHLQEAVKRLGSQKAVADEVGISQPRISVYCRQEADQELSNEVLQAWLSKQDWLKPDPAPSSRPAASIGKVTKALLPDRLRHVLNTMKAEGMIEVEFLDEFIQSGMSVDRFIQGLRQVGGMVALP